MRRPLLAAAIAAAALTLAPACAASAATTLTASPPAAPYCHDGACHPTDPAGFVTDGTRQADDGHCVGDDLQRSECFAARRPECAGHGAKSWDAAVACFAPEIDLYPWPKLWAANVLYCESRGDQWAANGIYVGVMQENGGSVDPAVNVYVGFHRFYVGGGPGQWSTSGMVCH